MANIIALEWDGKEVRMACAILQSRGPMLVHAGAIEWIDESHGEDSAATLAESGAELASRIAEKLKEWSFSKAEAVVAVRRAQVELRMLSVPPAPDDELPDIVRFQALQQFAALGDDWPLDYLRVITNESDSQQILAAVLPPKNLADIVQICDQVPLALQGLVLRPGATASLAQRRRMIAPGQLQLLVDLLPEEADLTVLDDQQIHIMRSVRLPSAENDNEPARRNAVLTEIRRTLVAGRSQLNGGAIHGIILCGGGPEHQWLETTIGQQLEMPVTYLLPLEDKTAGESQSTLRLSKELAKSPPEHPERYAALVGMLLDETSSTQHAFDFLRPKRPVEPPDQRKRWTQVALAVTMTLLLLMLGFWWLLAHRDAAIRELRAKSAEMDKLVTVADRQRTEVEQLDTWYRDTPNWLVEMRELSLRLPASDQLRLDLLQADGTTGGGGIILLKGLVDQSSTVSELETKLRDQWHAVSGTDRDYVGDDHDYPWHFAERITIQPRSYAKQHSEEPASSTSNDTERRTDNSTRKGATP